MVRMRIALLLLSLLLFPSVALAASGSDIAVTFDDLPVVTASTTSLARQKEITVAITGALRARHIPAIGFVNGQKLAVNGVPDPARVALLRHWLEAGLELGNH